MADRAAARIADQFDTGVLVSVGGDIAVAGPPPPGGWAIGIAVESSAEQGESDQVVAISQGGLASSSTAVRTWNVGTEKVHHIIDPSTGYAAAPYWTLVSVAGATCVEANALSTAAVVWGRDALDRLVPSGKPLVCFDVTEKSSPWAGGLMVGPRELDHLVVHHTRQRDRDARAADGHHGPRHHDDLSSSRPQLAGLRPTRAPPPDLDALGRLPGHSRAHQHPRHVRAYRLVGHRRALRIPLRSILGGTGTVALDLMVAVFLSSLLRSRMKPGTWRGIHWLAYGCWPIALAHTFGLGTDAGEPWVILVGALCILSVGVALLWRTTTTAGRGPKATPVVIDTPPPPAPRLVAASTVRGPRHEH